MRNEELKDISYELFILAISILSLVNWTLYLLPVEQSVLNVVVAIDLVLSMILLFDFLYRLLTAQSRRTYFFRQLGWLDFLGSLPFPQVKIIRISRIIRAMRLMREYGLGQLIKEFLTDRADSALFIVGFLILLVLEFGSMAVLAVEQGAPNATITTAGQALWWSIVTVSTVGYGDLTPVTPAGRLLAVIVIIIGVGLFGVVTGFLATTFVPGSSEGDQDSGQRLSEEHALIQEIVKLRQDHERTYAELNAKLENLSARLLDRTE